MEVVRLYKVVAKDGEISLTGLPFKKGQRLEMIVFSEPQDATAKPGLTARQLLNSELIGIWEDRDDIKDSSTYARYLREQAQRRSG